MKITKVINNQLSDSNQQLAISFQQLLWKVLVLSLTFSISIFLFNSFSQDVGINTQGYTGTLLAKLDVKRINGNTGNVPKPGNIIGSTIVCANATGVAYSIKVVSSATVYTWTVPSDATIATGQGSAAITVNFGTVSGNVCVTASNACGTSSQSCLAISVSACFTCGGTLTDSRDGQTYATVSIGTQCWMAQNLNYGTYETCTTSHEPQALGYKFCQNTTCTPCNNNSACPMGGLYEWANMMNISNSYASTYATPTPISYAQETCNPCSEGSGVQGLCPNSWHIPTDNEWTALTNYLSSNSGYWCNTNNTYIAKSMASTSGWTSYSCVNMNGCAIGCNEGTNNYSGFNGLPGGNSSAGAFVDANNFGYWWSAREDVASIAWVRILSYGGATVIRLNINKPLGFSVRCVKD